MDIGRALVRVMQMRPHAQQEMIGRVNPLPVAHAQPILADEMGCGEGSFLETGDPQEILIIAQAAAPSLHVWLLKENVVREFLMASRLIFHAGGDVFLLVALHAVFAESRAK